ncbi:30S ribosomal protein S19e [Candidatus Micrarchaeota archaeon]|nr:30S ribosomal protein S19e [Candidatus Micrarchaeota archaeon]
MVTVFDVPANKLVEKTAEKLKEVPEIKPPAYMAFVKTGACNIRAPDDKGFWFVRCASLLRKAYTQPSLGVGRMRTVYGGRKKRGRAMEKHAKAGGSIIRKALQQLEKAGFIKKDKVGRSITSKGKAFMDKAAKESSV